MEEHHDDQTHYEISLTATQAFAAFVLLLLSLGAAFVFGLTIGKGSADERLVVKREVTPVVTEASLIPRKGEGRIVELGVEEADEDVPAEPLADSAATATDVTDGATSTVAVSAESEPLSEPAAAAPAPEPVTLTPASPVVAPSAGKSAPPSRISVTHYAQLLSTSDQRVAEALAARLIDGGFNSAYVERGSTEKGPVFRVRVRFESEPDARAAEPRLRSFSKDVWITSR